MHSSFTVYCLCFRHDIHVLQHHSGVGKNRCGLFSMTDVNFCERQNNNMHVKVKKLHLSSKESVYENITHLEQKGNMIINKVEICSAPISKSELPAYVLYSVSPEGFACAACSASSMINVSENELSFIMVI